LVRGQTKKKGKKRCSENPERGVVGRIYTLLLREEEGLGLGGCALATEVGMGSARTTLNATPIASRREIFGIIYFSLFFFSGCLAPGIKLI